MEKNQQVTPARDERGRLLPGHNIPGPGRPPGMSHADKVRILLEPEREKLIGKLLKLALENDDGHVAVRALDTALTRLAPAPKQEAEKVHVPGLAEATTFAGKCDAVIQAVSTGEISAEAGERVLRLLDVYRKAHETDDLARRIAALEAGRAPAVIENGADLC